MLFTNCGPERNSERVSRTAFVPLFKIAPSIGIPRRDSNRIRMYECRPLTSANANQTPYSGQYLNLKDLSRRVQTYRKLRVASQPSGVHRLANTFECNVRRRWIGFLFLPKSQACEIAWAELNNSADRRPFEREINFIYRWNQIWHRDLQSRRNVSFLSVPRAPNLRSLPRRSEGRIQIRRPASERYADVYTSGKDSIHTGTRVDIFSSAFWMCKWVVRRPRRWGCSPFPPSIAVYLTPGGKKPKHQGWKIWTEERITVFVLFFFCQSNVVRVNIKARNNFRIFITIKDQYDDIWPDEKLKH